MLTINTNLSSLIVQSNLKTSTKGLNNAIERMTTGFKLNHAKDNAANYSISTSLTTKLGAYTVAEENAMMGLDMVQTASSSLSQMSDLASRLRSLAMQAQNGTYGSTSLDAINSEANAIVKELFRIQNTTQYNGIYLLNGGTSTNIATNAVATLSSASTSTQSSPRATSSGFIEAVQKRDTSAMTTLASVDENTTLDSGTYSISTAEELAKLATMANNSRIKGDVEFVLANDIDLSVYSSGEGWNPINLGLSLDENVGYILYNSVFDGNGYKIKNLCINRSNEDNQGLFGSFYNHVNIQNLAIENATIVGSNAVGTIFGSYTGNATTTIQNCYVTGSVKGWASVGGLVGALNDSLSIGDDVGDGVTIINSYSTANITGQSSCVGGLIGIGESSTITNSYSTGNVTGQSSCVGGLVGNGKSSIITNSYSTGSVTGQGNSIGGFIGAGASSTINNCYATGNVSVSGKRGNVGGLIGTGNGSKITNSYSTCNVSVTVTEDVQGSYVGGLVGNGKSSTITNCYSIGNVSANGRGVFGVLGGLIGYGDSANVTNSYSTGSITGIKGYIVSGLIAYKSNANCNNSYFVDKSGKLNGTNKITQKELNEMIAQGLLPGYLTPNLELVLQIGTNSTDCNRLDFSISQLDIFSLSGLSMANNSALETIDDFLKSINEQQTSLGAVENRLMSAIESIGVNINNLTSTRSTIKDADVAELSSEYIRNQILQQASATLLATANQNPSIALQLI